MFASKEWERFQWSEGRCELFSSFFLVVSSSSSPIQLARRRHSQALDRTARLAKGSELTSGGRRENNQGEEEDELFKDERKAALSKRSQFVLQ